MNSQQLIIHFSTSRRPLTRLRDGILFLLCWAMWSIVAVSVANGTEWRDLQVSLVEWFDAHRVFFNGLLASFHFSITYLLLVGILACTYLLWSNLCLITTPHNRRAKSGARGALSLDDLVHHFGLDIALIGAMQKEAKVVVFHACSGAVTEVCCAHQVPAALAAAAAAAATATGAATAATLPAPAAAAATEAELQSMAA